MIRVENLSKSFGDLTLLRGVSYHFPEREKIALIGVNGAGKSTFLNILAGLEEWDGGQITKPNQTTLGYLPQKPNPLPCPTVIEEAQMGAQELVKLQEKMNNKLESLENTPDFKAISSFDEAEALFRVSGGYALEAKAGTILLGLGFRREDFLKDPLVLSGGFRMRLELAKLFVQEPDFLILDEPTNHLDLPSLVWVEDYLRNFAGTLIFVSHDRALLNRLPTIILHLHKGNLTPYKGNFDKFLQEREAHLKLEESKRENLAKRRRELVSFIERFGAKATKARQAQSRLKMLARLDEEAEEIAPSEKDDSLVLCLPEPRPSGREIFVIKEGIIGYDKPLLKGINLSLERQQKIAVIGANGLGKTTLLKTIAAKIPSLGGSFSLGHNTEISFFAQDQIDTFDEGKTVLENLLSRAKISEKEARALLGVFLFSGDDVFKPFGVLSGGERSRLGLALLFVERANFLLLDEPTNHLDMVSTEALSAAMGEFSGSILFVSHDRTFVDNICTHILAITDTGEMQLFAGNIADYSRLAEVAGFPNVLNVNLTRTLAVKLPNEDKKRQAADQELAKDLRRNKSRLERSCGQTETKMQAIRTRLFALREEFSKIGVDDFAGTARLYSEQKFLETELKDLEDDWIASSEQLEEVNKKLGELGRR